MEVEKDESEQPSPWGRSTPQCYAAPQPPINPHLWELNPHVCRAIISISAWGSLTLWMDSWRGPISRVIPVDLRTTCETPSVDPPQAPALFRARPICSQGLQSKASSPNRSRSSDRPKVSASATASLARAGYSRPVEILCCLHGEPGGSAGLGGMDARSLIRDPASSRDTASPRSFRASFWRLSQGSELGNGFA